MGSLHSPKFLYTIFIQILFYFNFYFSYLINIFVSFNNFFIIYLSKIFLHHFTILTTIFIKKSRDDDLKDHNQLFSKTIFIKTLFLLLYIIYFFTLIF